MSCVLVPFFPLDLFAFGLEEEAEANCNAIIALRKSPLLDSITSSSRLLGNWGFEVVDIRRKSGKSAFFMSVGAMGLKLAKPAESET